MPLWDMKTNLQVLQIFAAHALFTDIIGLLPLIS